MSNTIPGASFGPAATRGPDGLAVIGRTLHDLRGIRYDEGEGAGAPGTGNGQIVTPPVAPVAPVPTPPPTTAAETAPVVPATTWDGKVESLDPGVQKIIADLRKEAGDHRVAAKTAGEKAQQELADKLAVALGIKKDDAKDPEALAKSLTEAQATARESAIKLAVYQAAGAHSGNPDALLDSTSFLAKVKDLDPTGADFGTQVGEAIKAAVTANPSLKTTRAVGASTVETPGGTGEVGQITEAQLAQMTPEQIAEAFDKGQLKALL